MSFNTSILTVQLGGEIDMNVAGVSDLIFNSNDLHVIGFTLHGTDVTGLTGNPTFTVGTNSPNYDNIVATEVSGITATGDCFQRLYNGNAVPVVPLGSSIKINITIAGTGTTNLQKVNLLTYPIQI